MPGNGCEVDTTSDGMNCGSCGHGCPALQTCLNSTCQCVQGTTLCGAACTDTQSDASNCGACGNTCGSGSGCAGGHCTSCGLIGQTCCGADAGSPCVNSAACVSGHCSCQSPRTACGDVCVNLTNDPAHCNSCSTSCMTAHVATAACNSVGGTPTCQIVTCEPGFASCNLLWQDGCNYHTAVDPLNCNSCGHVCPAASSGLPNEIPSCSNGVCGLECAAGWADCDSNPANGCETNTYISASYCGLGGVSGCGCACPLPSHCGFGSCQLACGGLQQPCCATTPACNANLTCNPMKGCECGYDGEPCCNGSMCYNNGVCESGTCMFGVPALERRTVGRF